MFALPSLHCFHSATVFKGDYQDRSLLSMFSALDIQKRFFLVPGKNLLKLYFDLYTYLIIFMYWGSIFSKWSTLLLTIYKDGWTRGHLDCYIVTRRGRVKQQHTRIYYNLRTDLQLDQLAVYRAYCIGSLDGEHQNIVSINSVCRILVWFIIYASSSD